MFNAGGSSLSFSIRLLTTEEHYDKVSLDPVLQCNISIWLVDAKGVSPSFGNTNDVGRPIPLVVSVGKVCTTRSPLVSSITRCKSKYSMRRTRRTGIETAMMQIADST
jgi:hypothetical protein